MPDYCNRKAISWNLLTKKIFSTMLQYKKNLKIMVELKVETECNLYFG